MNKKFFSIILMTVLFAALSSCKKDTPTFTVTFDSKGGTPTPATQTVEKGGMVEKPADPTLTNYQFAGWTTADNATSPLWDFATGTVTADMTLYAKWVQNSYSITVYGDENGTASANVISAVAGDEITLTATANSGYRFVEWQVVEGSITLSAITDNPATFIMPDEEVEVKAVFVLLEGRYSITVTGDENGTASANVSSAVEGELIILTATANSGYSFAEWQVIKGGIYLYTITYNSAIFNMPSEEVEVKAVFVQLEQSIYNVTVTSDGNGTASASVFSIGENEYVTITAIPNSGYRFLEWQLIKGDVVFSRIYNLATFYIIPDEEIEVKAIFVPSVGLLESIIPQNYINWRPITYIYDSQNRITNYNYITLDYNAVGDLEKYRWFRARSGEDIAFSKNGNIINFILHRDTYMAGPNYRRDANGEIELNSQGFPVKLTSEFVEGRLGSEFFNWSYTATLTWQNGNLTKLEWKIESEQGSSTGTKTYTYDDKKTPFHNCNTPKWALWCLSYDWIYAFSMDYWYNDDEYVFNGYNANNLKTETWEEEGFTRTFEYTYNDDGFPVTRTWGTGTNTFTETYTYE